MNADPAPSNGVSTAEKGQRTPTKDIEPNLFAPQDVSALKRQRSDPCEEAGKPVLEQVAVGDQGQADHTAAVEVPGVSDASLAASVDDQAQCAPY